MGGRDMDGQDVLLIAGIIVLALLALIGILAVVVHRLAAAMGAAHAPVDGYDRRLEIWGEQVPGNRPESKRADMNVGRGGNLFLYRLKFFADLTGERFRDVERTMDTFTWLYEIQGGYELPTYEDRPYLVPYLAAGSDRGVIVLPGGGFGYKSMDGEYGEGRDVARTLQRHGVSAFVLHYRANPYEYPVPLLDVQRAVRYLKYHAGALGLDPDKLGLLGFSAGGALVGGHINLVRGQDLFPEGYAPDEVDRMDDSVAAPAMIYPGLTFRYTPRALFGLFDADAVRDPERRAQLVEGTDMVRYACRSARLPQFVAWGTRDRIVGVKGPAEYVRSARAAGAEVAEVVARGKGHAFGQRYYMADYLAWLDQVLSRAGEKPEQTSVERTR